MYANQRTNRKARIATAAALVLMVLALGAPTVVADHDPSVNEDGSASIGSCAGANPWRVPPDYYVDVESCLDPF